MYQEFYGLRELPFELTANPRYLYLSPGHREALSNLQYGLSAAKAVTVLIGEAGTGKTTLLHAALSSERCQRVRAVHVNNPAMTRCEFLETLARSLRLSAEAAKSKAVLLEELESALRDGRSRGQVTALVVDEAQSLSTDLLEEVRLLGNIETPAGNAEFGQDLCRAAFDLFHAIPETSKVSVEPAFGFRSILGVIGIKLVFGTAAERIHADDAAVRKEVQKEQRRATFPGADFQNPHGLAPPCLQQLRPHEKMRRRPVGREALVAFPIRDLRPGQKGAAFRRIGLVLRIAAHGSALCIVRSSTTKRRRDQNTEHAFSSTSVSTMDIAIEPSAPSQLE